MTAPITLASADFPAAPGTLAFKVVLRDFGETAHDRYVTHCINEGETSHYWGHYFNDLREARKDFHERCARYS